MLRRVFTGVLAGGLFLLLGGTAVAAPPQTETMTQKNVVETFVDVVPSCEGGGPLYTVTTTSNSIEHITVFDDGRVHATFTQTGTFVAVPLNDPSLPSFTGKFTTWGGFNDTGEGRQRDRHVQRARDGFGRLVASPTTSSTTSTRLRPARSSSSRTATDRGRELRRANGTGPAELPRVRADIAGGHASGVERAATR